jgi:hypothetical protein
VAYATLALVTVGFSWRLYPISYEWSRVLRVALAGGAAYAVTSQTVAESTPPLAGLVLRAATVGAVYLAVLYVTRFFHAGELRVLQDIRRRALQRRRPRALETDSHQVEMAGEIVATAPEPAADESDAAFRTNPEQGVSGSSRDSHR